MNGEHEVKLFWFPHGPDGEGHYEVRCLKCGMILCRIDHLVECKPPGTLGVMVSDAVKTKDTLR